MKLNRFEVVTGRYIEEIPGQSDSTRKGIIKSKLQDILKKFQVNPVSDMQ